jgi:hypothetical protein
MPVQAYNGGSGFTTPESVHIKLKLKGTPEQIVMFHALCKFRDGDWPFTRREGTARTAVVSCPKCGGMSYRRPHISPADVKAAAKQAGLRKVKIQHFAKPCLMSAVELAAYTLASQNAIDLEGGEDDD